MRIKVRGQEIKIPKRVLVEIGKKYNPKDYLYIADFGICFMLVYEDDFVELDKVMYGYLIYPTYPVNIRFRGFATMEIDYRHFSISEKREAVRHYLGVEPEKDKDVEKLFEELVWLKKELEEPIDIPDDLLF